jgi:putative ABC transport system permease protein
MTLREIMGRLAAWRRRDALEREVSDEIEAHIELLARDFVHGGMTHADARAAARRRVGNVTGLREASREYWGFPALERVVGDVRYALRCLRRSPGFTAAVVVTLGLGIGANAAMFGVIDRLMFRPFPYLRDPGAVNRVYLQTTYNGRTSSNSVMPYTRYVDLAGAANGFAAFAAQSEWRFAVGSGAASQVRKVAGVSGSFFEFFDAHPVRGRFFTTAEDSVPQGAMVAVISHALWRTEFASGEVTGRTLKVGMLDYTIIGVAPPGFVGTAAGGAPDVFVPITTVPANLGPWSLRGYYTEYRWDWTQVLVRRRPGVTVEAAGESLTSAYIRSRAAARIVNPRMLPDSVVRPRAIAGAVKTAAGPGAGPESRVLLWVSGVAGIVLLIGCASVANLMLARVIRRRREITVRLALGVSHGRLAAQLLTESLVLALLGCGAGLLAAQWGGVAIRRMLLPEGSSFMLAGDWRTLGVALACAVITALLTVIGPAVVATRTDIAGMLKAGVREGTHQRSRAQTGLLLVQVALSVVLLVGAGVFVGSLRNARAVPLGYDARPVIEVIPDLRGHQVDNDAFPALRGRLLDAAQAIPGVEYASYANSRPFFTNTALLRVPGIDSVANLGRFNLQIASPDFFNVMQTRLLRGRGLAEADHAGSAPVAVVSEAMAAALWPGDEPLGRCIHVSLGDQPPAVAPPCISVVGIAENTAQQSLVDDERLMYYLPVEQVPMNHIYAMLLRMSGPRPLAQLERVRRELSRAMPGDGYVTVRALQEVVDDQSRSWRLGATLFVAFGGLALVVAVVGVYGVISYGVAGRAHELGVRVALGARPGDLVRLVVAQGVRLALAGTAIGLSLALLAARWVQPLLFQQSATDPAIYAAIGGALIGVAAVASLLPALRAARTDPNTALRAD